MKNNDLTISFLMFSLVAHSTSRGHTWHTAPTVEGTQESHVAHSISRGHRNTRDKQHLRQAHVGDSTSDERTWRALTETDGLLNLSLQTETR